LVIHLRQDISLARRRPVRVRRTGNSQPCASGLSRFEGYSKGATKGSGGRV
jgi:hypothetical protein